MSMLAVWPGDNRRFCRLGPALDLDARGLGWRWGGEDPVADWTAGARAERAPTRQADQPPRSAATVWLTPG
jgi:hypothetical protein